MFTKIITQTQTNALATLTVVVKIPLVPTPKGPSTVVVNQGTLEMATTVQVGSWNSCLNFRYSFDITNLVTWKKRKCSAMYYYNL